MNGSDTHKLISRYQHLVAIQQHLFGSRHSLHCTVNSQKIYQQFYTPKICCVSFSLPSLSITPLLPSIKCNCTLSIRSAITLRCHIFLHLFPTSLSSFNALVPISSSSPHFLSVTPLHAIASFSFLFYHISKHFFFKTVPNPSFKTVISFQLKTDLHLHLLLPLSLVS